jgi:hypothetical protein
MKMHRLRKTRKPATAQKVFQRRSQLFELLEARALLAGDSTASLWQNPYIKQDVNGDFVVTPADALKVIDSLNRNGAGQLDSAAKIEIIRGSNEPVSFGRSQYVDVSGDGQITPQDLLLVIDSLNRLQANAVEPDVMELKTGIFDVAGNPITEIVVGTDFLIGLTARDARSPAEAAGPRSAYADVTLDNTALASFNPGPLAVTPTIKFEDLYNSARVGTIIPASMEVDDAGAFSSAFTPPPSLDPLEFIKIWTTSLRSNAAGLMTFSTNPSDSLVFNDLLLFEPTDTNATATGVFLQNSVTAVAEAAPSLSITDVFVPEGDAGSTNATFNVTLSSASARDVYVIYSTSNVNASAGSDYTAQISGTLTFAAGTTQQPINIPVLGDLAFEGDEVFHVNLLLSSNATIADGIGNGTIVDNETAPLVSVSDAQLLEGDSGTLNMLFTVELDQPAGSAVTVNFSTQNGTALAGQDYLPQVGILTFAPGETSKIVSVPIVGDTVIESSESFSLMLTGVTNALITDDTGVGTIFDNDALGFSINDVAVVEGNVGTTSAIFSVTLSSPQPVQTTVVFTTFDGSATVANNDYQPTSGTLTFAAGETMQTVTVLVIGDTTPGEADETFSVTLSNPTNTVLFDPLGIGTILNDDGPPTLSVSNVVGSEGTNLIFSVTLNVPSNQVVTVPFTTALFVGADAATPNTDFATTSGVLTFAPGVTSRSISVAAIADGVAPEPNEFFLVQLGAPTNAVIADGEGLGTIVANGSTPIITISDEQIQEGDSGTSNMVFTVILSEAAASNVVVGFATQDDSATAGLDYLSQSGQVTFFPGQTTRQITVPIVGDFANETIESFFVNLSSPVNAVIGDNRGVGTIVDNDAQGFTISDATVLEGDAGTTIANFVVTLSNAVPIITTVAFTTSNGTATVANNDYQPTAGILTFAPGQTSQTISVLVNGDTALEPTETFNVTLSNATNTVLFDATGVGTILDDDGAHPTLVEFRFEVLDATSAVVPDGGSLGIGQAFTLNVYADDVSPDDAGLLSAYLDVLYSAAIAGAVGPITFNPNYNVARRGNFAADGLIDEAGAVNPNGAPGSAEVLLFSIPMVTQASGVLTFTGDPADDPQSEVSIYSPVSAVPANQIEYGTYTVNVGINSFQIDNVTATEGNAGTKDFVFTVTRSNPSANQAFVQFSTADGTATLGNNDYQATNGTLTFNIGETQKTITVRVNGDLANEPDETFTVGLSGAVGATIGTGIGTGTILNDDAPPTFSISDDSKIEGTNLQFTVSLSTPQPFTTTVVFTSSDGTATVSGNDYQPTNGTLTFAPNQTSQTVTVVVNSDGIVEPDETLNVTLSNPTSATLLDPVGVGTILNDDSPPTLSISDAMGAEGASLVFTVTLSAASNQLITVPFSTAPFLGPDAATTGTDFNPTSGVLTFQPGITSRTISVNALLDAVSPEPNEFFLVQLGTPANALIADGEALGTIFANGALPIITIADQQLVEGDSGTTNMVFTVSLSQSTISTVIVGFATQDDTATALSDYLPQSGQLTFAPGETIAQIIVPIIGDLAFESVENFFVNLSSPSNAVFGDNRGVGTIIDNDSQGFSLTDVVIVEGDSGTKTANFTVTLLGTQSVQSSVAFATIDGTATVAGGDYLPTAGVLTFAPGQTSRTISVTINGDTTVEPDETFTVLLSNPTNTIVVDGTGVGSILDDDGVHPTLVSFRFEVVDSGNNVIPDGGSLNLGQSFTLNVYADDLSPADEGLLSAYLDVLYTASIVDAVGPITFNPTFNAGRRGNFATDGIINEAGAVNPNGPPGSAEVLLFSIPMIANASGIVTFTGDPADDATSETAIYQPISVVPPNQIEYPTLTLDVGSNAFIVDNVSLTEGNAGTKSFNFTVTRFNPEPTQATVQFTTNDSTATLADGDYLATSGILTFAPGETQKTVTVTVNGDTKFEADERFLLTLFGAVGATVGVGAGTGTILNDDAAPSISISDAIGAEGTNLQFTVTLSAVSGQQITVPFNTAASAGPNAATPGSDFTSTSGVITFAPGVTSRTISVAAISDIVTPEPAETFLVQLGAPSAGTVADGTGIGTINDAPPAGISGFVYIDADNDGIKDTGEVGLGGVIVTLTSEDGSLTRTTTTSSTGSYQFLLLPPARYFVTETQPGFYADGKDTPAAFVVANDRFLVDSSLNPSIADLNFGEKGVLPAFLAAAINRRLFFATTVNDPMNGLSSPIVNADLTKGDIWLSFDAGWDGLRKFQAFFNTGNVTLKLYDLDFRGDLHVLATSQLVNGRQEIAWTDALETPAKPLFLQISGNSTNASVKIIDTLRVVAQAFAEGNTGTTNATITVKLSAPQTAPVVVQYATANATATQPADITATSGTITFAAGETSKQITVPIVGDLLDENDETFVINLLGATSFVEVAPGPFSITITDNDPTVRLNIADSTIAEGDAGTTTAIFNVLLSAPSGRQVTVAYTTSANSAAANGDFTPVSGTLTFAPGVLLQSIAVPILGDTFLEGDETFSVILGSPVGATILDGLGVGTIFNDDGGPQLSGLSSSGQSGSGFLAYSESSDSSSNTGSSSSITPPSSTTAAGSSSSSQRIASTKRTTTSAVDEVMADEEDWLLVA